MTRHFDDLPVSEREVILGAREWVIRATVDGQNEVEPPELIIVNGKRYVPAPDAQD